jgi:hypothetical protein
MAEFINAKRPPEKQSFLYEESEIRMNSEKTCRHSVQNCLSSPYLSKTCRHSVQNCLSSRYLSKASKIKIYRNQILSFFLYGCETWSLTLREEHRLTVFENRVLRRIFGPKRDEVTGEWRKLHNEELQ